MAYEELKYLDKYGLPGTKQADGSLDMGDSAAIYFNILALDGSVHPNTNSSFYFTGGRPIRHPDNTKWWGQIDRYSRDQLIPLLSWAAIKDQKDRIAIQKLFASHLEHGLCFAWNTRGNGEMDMPWKLPDITALEIWSLWLRIYKPFGYRAILWLLDIEILVNSFIWKSREDRVTRNHMLSHIASKLVSPTWVSRLSYKMNDWKRLIQKWDAHCKDTGECPTADLFRNHLE